MKATKGSRGRPERARFLELPESARERFRDVDPAVGPGDSTLGNSFIRGVAGSALIEGRDATSS